MTVDFNWDIVTQELTLGGEFPEDLTNYQAKKLVMKKFSTIVALKKKGAIIRMLGREDATCAFCFIDSRDGSGYCGNCPLTTQYGVHDGCESEGTPYKRYIYDRSIENAQAVYDWVKGMRKVVK